jgi:hypothetical protein
MNTHLKTSLLLASSMFISSNALAHCNQLAIIAPKDVIKMSVTSSQYLQNKDPKPFGHVMILERLPWWNGGGIIQPLKAEIRMEKSDGSILTAQVQQGYCHWISHKIADNNVNIRDVQPIPHDWKNPQNFRAEHRDAPGRISFD